MIRRWVPQLWLAAVVVLSLVAPGRAQTAPATTTAPADFFTLIAVPDPQHYAEKFPETYYKQTEWIRRQAAAEKIAFVAVEGDVVQSYGDKAAEWEIADKALSVLDGVTPWGVCIGNHDFDKANDAERGAENFLKHFGPERFRKQPWFGGASDNGLSTCQLIEPVGVKLMILHLEIAVPDAAIAWAQKTIDAHPDRQVIVVTHIYLDDRTKSRDKNTVAYLGKDSRSGEHTWQELVRKNPRIFLVLCGHWGEAGGQWHQDSINDAGGTVHEVLADYQHRKDGGEGYLRIMRFVPKEKCIQVRTYSPLLDKELPGEAAKFDLSWEPAGAPVVRKP